MDPQRVTPPPPECLERRYPSSQKGGTIIAADVTDFETHQELQCDPDGYRPDRCRCGHDVLHVHDYPWRVLLAEAGRRGVRIVRYVCVLCGAVWRIVPAFLARHLRRSWKVVEVATQMRARSRNQPKVPVRTVRRWQARLASAASTIVDALSGCRDDELVRVAKEAGAQPSRRELVHTYGAGLAGLAAVVHRIAPGVRVM